jgi:hypothetical protein
MSDKLNQSIAVVPTFVAGESPSPEKLQVLGLQVKRLSNAIESAVGDIHSQSWPYSAFSESLLTLGYGRSLLSNVALSGATERNLDIANLARLIGPASNLNPRTLSEETVIVENVPRDVYEFSLRYIPKGPLSASNPVFSDTATHINFKTSESDLTDIGDYFVTATGKVYRFDAPAEFVSAGTVTYTYDAASNAGGNNYTGARFNTIPDPNQANLGVGCTVSAINGDGRYPVALPTITHQQSNYTGTGVALGTSDANHTQQLYLPQVITDNFFTSEEIPKGFLFLRNHTTGEVYEDATYIFNDSTSIEVGNVDLDDAISNANVFVIFTVGTDITTSIDDLRIKHQHNHDRSKGEPFVDIDGIVGFTRAGGVGVRGFGPSDRPGNFAPQYLHRDGYSASYDQNMNVGNAMLGDLVLAPVSANKNSPIAANGESRKIIFGRPDTSPAMAIYRDSNDDLRIEPGSGGAKAVVGKELIVEEGINGDHGSVSTVAIKCYSREVLGEDPTLVTVNIVMSSLASADIYSCNVLLTPDGGDTWYPPKVGGTYDYNFTIDDSGASPELNIVIGGGAGWALVSPTNLFKVRLVIWYAT